MAAFVAKKARVLPCSTDILSLDANSLKFMDGNIFVVLDFNDNDYWLQLHDAVIKRKSTKIANIVSTDPKKLDSKTLYLNRLCKVPAGAKMALVLQDDGGHGNVPILTEFSSIRAHIDEVAIEEEKDIAEEDGSKGGTFSVGPNVLKFRDAFKSLFAAFYDEPLSISGDDILVALEQSEDLVKVATALSAVPAVRAQISNVLQEFRQKMYIAIKDNPPRWLNLSLVLESAPIFSEAVIHIVGCWPDWPWDTPKQTLGPDVVHLIDRKGRSLETQRMHIDRRLMVNTINSGEGDQERSATLQEHPDAWLAAGVFRDWLVKELNSCPGPSEIGRLYRKLQRGGEAYLPNTEVDQTVEWVGSNLDPESIIKNVQLLKKFASETVEKICENGLMIPPEALNLGYLTNVDVRPADYPW